MSIQWSLVIFTVLTGMAGWMLACVAVDEFLGKTKKTAFMATLIAAIVGVVGGIASATHLSHVENIMAVLNHPTEGIFLEAVLVGLMVVFAVIYLILVKRESAPGGRKVCIILAALFGVALSFASGKSYMMASLPTWNTFLLPLGYAGTAIPSGVSAYLVVACLQKEDTAQLKIYALFLLVGGVIAGVTGALYLFMFAADQIIMGCAVVLLSGIVPAVCGYLGMRNPERLLMLSSVALACALVGALFYRCAMWLVGLKLVDLFGLSI